MLRSWLLLPVGAAVAAYRRLIRVFGANVETPTPSRRSAPARRGPRGPHDEHLIRLIRQRPGLTVPEAAEAIEIAATDLYPIIRRLELNGALVQLGRELHPRPARPS